MREGPLRFDLPEVDHTIPERRLAAAVLQRAVQDLLDTKHHATSQKHRRCAYEWIFLDGTEEDYGFIWLCKELDLRPEHIQDALLERYKAGEKIHPVSMRQ